MLVCGCGGEQTVEITQWTFQAGADGLEAPITLPTHVNARLPREPSTFLLKAKCDLPLDFRGRDLVLSIPHLSAKATLFVAGRTALSLADEGDELYRSAGPTPGASRPT